MESKELKEKARSLGIKPKFWIGKAKLIHSIQSAEGNFPCFGTAKDHCDQLNCCFRDDCLSKKDFSHYGLKVYKLIYRLQCPIKLLKVAFNASFVLKNVQ
jgi:hypothetical protein